MTSSDYDISVTRPDPFSAYPSRRLDRVFDALEAAAQTVPWERLGEAALRWVKEPRSLIDAAPSDNTIAARETTVLQWVRRAFGIGDMAQDIRSRRLASTRALSTVRPNFLRFRRELAQGGRVDLAMIIAYLRAWSAISALRSISTLPDSEQWRGVTENWIAALKSAANGSPIDSGRSPNWQGAEGLSNRVWRGAAAVWRWDVSPDFTLSVPCTSQKNPWGHSTTPLRYDVRIGDLGVRCAAAGDDEIPVLPPAGGLPGAWAGSQMPTPTVWLLTRSPFLHVDVNPRRVFAAVSAGGERTTVRTGTPAQLAHLRGIGWDASLIFAARLWSDLSPMVLLSPYDIAPEPVIAPLGKDKAGPTVGGPA